MSWYSIVLLCVISCWFGCFLMGILLASKCWRCPYCKTKELSDRTLKCKKCGTKNLHITNRFKYSDNTQDFIVICHSCGEKYEIHNNIVNSNERFKSNEN